ncbi:uncharacterized protein METZ01_LOCUS256802 [marine metagenome]|uniref:Uncharacterized protein n=1 Tax=marine metagenome TaxID=408172 RepID=A0A382IWP0_9ZZZZ
MKYLKSLYCAGTTQRNAFFSFYRKM